MSEYKITLVPDNHVMGAWELAEPFIAKAIPHTHGRYELEDVLDALLHYNHDLWLVFNEEGIQGALVTAIKQYPRKRYLDLAFIGGENGHSWKDQMLDILQRWAYDNSCDGIEASARLGWQKIFKDDGYRPLWQIFELPMGDEGVGE